MSLETKSVGKSSKNPMENPNLWAKDSDFSRLTIFT